MGLALYTWGKKCCSYFGFGACGLCYVANERLFRDLIEMRRRTGILWQHQRDKNGYPTNEYIDMSGVKISVHLSYPSLMNLDITWSIECAVLHPVRFQS